MPTDTTVNNLVINKLTKAQYDAIQSPSDTEIYLVPDVIDTAPTSGSDNMVTSGGVYTALSSKANASDIPVNVSNLNNDAGYTTNTGTVTSTGGTITVNNIQVVTDLPLSPDANTLYLIPE